MDHTARSDIERLIYDAYDAFNRRDLDAALALMTEDVQWANGWEGGHVRGRTGVRDYWTRQWAEFSANVTLVSLDFGEGSVTAEVDQRIVDLAGNELAVGRVRHRFGIRHGKVSRMDIVGQ